MGREYQPPEYGRVISASTEEPALWLNEALGVVFKVWSEETGGALSIVEHSLKPEALASAVHVHYNEDEITYVLEGEITVQLGEQIIQAPRGTMVFKPRGIPHTFWNQARRPARLLQVFTPGGFERYLEEAAKAFGDPARQLELAEPYRLEVQPDTVVALVQQYHLKLPAARAATA